MKKIYCFNNGGRYGTLQAVAISENGVVLADHICSSEDFMPHDLGMTSSWKHKQYNKHYGEGNWELEWVADIDGHEGIQKAFELNKQLKEV